MATKRNESRSIQLKYLRIFKLTDTFINNQEFFNNNHKNAHYCIIREPDERHGLRLPLWRVSDDYSFI